MSTGMPRDPAGALREALLGFSVFVAAWAVGLTGYALVSVFL